MTEVHIAKEDRLPEFRRKLLKALPPMTSDEEYNSVFDAILTAACEEVAVASDLMEAAQELAARYPLDPELTRLQIAIAKADAALTHPE